MFKPLRYDSGKSKTRLTEASTTIRKFDALVVNSSGYLQRAASGSTEVQYVALEDVTTAAATHSNCLVLDTRGVEFEADSAGNTSQAKEGYKADLSDYLTLDLTATTNKVFEVTKVVGAAADKKVRGFFLRKTA